MSNNKIKLDDIRYLKGKKAKEKLQEITQEEIAKDKKDRMSFLDDKQKTLKWTTSYKDRVLSYEDKIKLSRLKKNKNANGYISILIVDKMDFRVLLNIQDTDIFNKTIKFLKENKFIYYYKLWTFRDEVTEYVESKLRSLYIFCKKNNLNYRTEAYDPKKYEKPVYSLEYYKENRDKILEEKNTGLNEKKVLEEIKQEILKIVGKRILNKINK